MHVLALFTLFIVPLGWGDPILKIKYGHTLLTTPTFNDTHKITQFLAICLAQIV